MSKVCALPEGSRKVLSFYREILERDGVGPSIAQVQERFGWKSRTSVVQHLKVLQREKILVLEDGVRHRYTLTQPARDNLGLREIPILTLRAGEKLDLNKVNKRILVDQRMLPDVRNRKLYAVRLASVPPENALIFSGRETLLITPSVDAIRGKCWLLVNLGKQTTVLYYPRIRGVRFLLRWPGDREAYAYKSDDIIGAVVGVFFAQSVPDAGP